MASCKISGAIQVCVQVMNSLISDSHFVKLHLHRSISRSTDFAHTRLLIKCRNDDLGEPYISSRTVSSLLKSHSVGSRRSFLSEYDFIGTCNGLICLSKVTYDIYKRKYFMLRFLNPATRMTQDSRSFYSNGVFGFGYDDSRAFYSNGVFGFGYDCSSDTYKVVEVTPEATTVNVYNMCGKFWRTIQVSPLPPMRLRRPAVYVSNTLNWLANLPFDLIYPDYLDDTGYINELIDTDLYFIVSFDLGKEEYAQLSLPYCPRRRNEISNFVPILGVLRDCLCISQNSEETHNFVLWQMKEFGVHKSWTQLFNIIVDEKKFLLPCFAMCMSENGDTLLFPKLGWSQAVLYNQRDNKLEDTKIPNNIFGCSDVKNYIESLVLPS